MTPIEELRFLVESELLERTMDREHGPLLRLFIARLVDLDERELRTLRDVRYRNGSIIARTDAHFIKVPLASSSTGWREPAAWDLARRHAVLSQLVLTGEVRRRGPLMALVTPYCAPAPPSVSVSTLLSRLSEGTRRARFAMADVPEVADGLLALERTAPGLVRERRALVQSLSARDVFIGPMHGDAHDGNVIVDASGALRFVDCGELRLEGLPALDAIHAGVESAAADTGLSWPWIVRDLDRTLALPAFVPILRCGLTPSELRTVYGLYRLAGAYVAAPRAARKIGAVIFGDSGHGSLP